MGTPKPSVVETKVSQSAGSKASLADVGLMVLSHERGFQKSSRALALSACSSNPFISTRRVESATVALMILLLLFLQKQSLVLLREVKLALFREARADVVLTQDLEGRPILGELLRDTALGRDDGLREMLGLLVLRGGRLRGGRLTPLECQMKAVELR
jgi:hypothetical protein